MKVAQVRARSVWVLGTMILCLIFGISAVGCGETSETSATTAAEATTTEPAEGDTTASTGAGTGEPIKIGMLLERTGALAAYGYAHELTAKAAVKQINDEGGIGGRPIELVFEDTETQAATGAIKARKLVESDGVDFLLGTNSSAVTAAVGPVARELETVYFSTSSSAGLHNAGKGNRWVFCLQADTKQEAMAAAKFGTETLKKTKWFTAVVDYAFGWDGETSFSEEIAKLGGKVNGSVRVPLGSADWLKYLQGKISGDTEAVYFANFGTDFNSFIRDIQVAKPGLTLLAQSYAFAGQKPETLGAAAEGVYCISAFPATQMPTATEYEIAYRKALGMDELGREISTGKVLIPSVMWGTWESLYTIKEVVEEIGWESAADNAAFIKATEGRTLKEGFAHPEGTKTVRAEDHMTIKGIYIEQIKDGKIITAARVDAAAITYPPEMNLQQEQPLE